MFRLDIYSLLLRSSWIGIFLVVTVITVVTLADFEANFNEDWVKIGVITSDYQ